MFAFGIFLKRTLDDTSFDCIRLDIVSFEVVDIANGSFTRPLAAPEFLANPTLYILRQVVGVIFTLAKGHLEHKQALRSWLKPECWEAQSNNLASVDAMNDLAAVNTVSSQSIGVPRQQTNRLFTGMNLSNHFVKDRSAWLLCAFALGKGFGNRDVLSLSKVSQLRKLRLYAHDLAFFIFAGLSSIEVVFHLFMLQALGVGLKTGCLMMLASSWKIGTAKLVLQALLCNAEPPPDQQKRQPRLRRSLARSV